MVSLDDAVVARLDSQGSHFEVLIDPHLGQAMRNGEDVDLEDLLAIDEVFKDARKGDRASDEHVQKVFETDKIEDVVQKIVMEGDNRR